MPGNCAPAKAIENISECKPGSGVSNTPRYNTAKSVLIKARYTHHLATLSDGIWELKIDEKI